MTVSQLVLRPATPQESDHIHKLNAASWAGELDVETYHARERLLASTPLTRNGGLKCWVLVNPDNNLSKILSSCETITKNAFISAPPVGDRITSTVVTVKADAVGSVFTPVEQRGNGYARTMLQLLREMLMRKNEEGFSVLYSDIGKKFYAELGWMPCRSSHIEFPPIDSNTANIIPIKYLTLPDIPRLCVKDVASLHRSLSELPSNKTRIAFVPDYQTMEWHWAREEFVAPILRKHIGIKPEIKGAITVDGKCWLLWNRDFGKNASQLYIIRYVNLSKDEQDPVNENQITALFRAAGMEAHKWGLQKVTIWNPDETCVRAATRAAGSGVKFVERDTDSICSLMMHKTRSGPDLVDWEANEKFAWC